MNPHNKPLRGGKLLDNERGRGWRAKLYGPSNKVAYHRVAFKDLVTKKWVYPTVRDDADPDDYFAAVEKKLNHQVSLPAARSKAPTMNDLAVRYLDWPAGSLAPRSSPAAEPRRPSHIRITREGDNGARVNITCETLVRGEHCTWQDRYKAGALATVRTVTVTWKP